MIDRKKLKTAFVLMRKQGLYAEENFACCNICGVRASQEHRSVTDQGWAFYHGQANKVMKKGRDLCIGYGSFDNSDVVKDMSRIGGVVRDCLTLAGLECVWDAGCAGKIIVPNLPDKPEPAPRPKLSLVAGTSRDAQKSENSPEKPAVRPELRLVINRPAAIRPTPGSETERTTKVLSGDQAGDVMGATHNTEE